MSIASRARQDMAQKTRYRRQHLGTFRCPFCAALAYDASARLQYGQFSRVNFPDIFLPNANQESN